MPAHLFDLTGKVAVVTGGGGGIGLGMAEAMAGLGATVSLWGRNRDKLAAAAEKIGGTFEVCDVADKSEVDAAFTAVLARHGRVDGMFANAGVTGGAPKLFHERDIEEWRRLMAVNLDGVVYCFQAAARHMDERAGRGDAFGRLVATSSVASVDGAARNEHYGASKGALNSFVRALAVEQARFGVTVNAILPGYIETDMTERLTTNDKFVNAVKPRIPMRRFGVPEDFGGVAAYLMSDASGYHTGREFVIDGGYTIF